MGVMGLVKYLTKRFKGYCRVMAPLYDVLRTSNSTEESL
ncbi:hypothetical protein HMPREF1077_02662 [Parabacteroides johnsonii CL02T12C29]|uniref:Uncharacterized protein n=1 Tax=Parabacteroides johnsonii CL02T12C29 TaxID=999419 RepID=K5Z8T0_9BACT|nr:hypothetical protein HMPREF1077_02662 [Parabacteroides johnsonii CL02T12C29]